MKQARINELRKTVLDESISYGELIEVETAFNQIPDNELRELRQNATVYDMLNEIETYNKK